MHAIDEMVTFRTLLDEVFTPTQITVWLQRPNEALGGARPIDAFMADGLDGVKAAIPECKPEETEVQGVDVSSFVAGRR